MNRRGYLTVCGTLCGGLAGCSGNSQDSSEGTAGPARDGYPPESGTTPTDRTIDTSAFETTTVEGVDVPLAPIDATHHWYRGRAARFVDARGQAQYDRSHITGAVLSPAPDGTGDDPVEAWHEPTGQREATLIGDDGTYTLELHFSDVAPESTIAVETPGYRIEDSLQALTAQTVTDP